MRSFDQPMESWPVSTAAASRTHVPGELPATAPSTVTNTVTATHGAGWHEPSSAID